MHGLAIEGLFEHPYVLSQQTALRRIVATQPATPDRTDWKMVINVWTDNTKLTLFKSIDISKYVFTASKITFCTF